MSASLFLDKKPAGGGNIKNSETVNAFLICQDSPDGLVIHDSRDVRDLCQSGIALYVRKKTGDLFIIGGFFIQAVEKVAVVKKSFFAGGDDLRVRDLDHMGFLVEGFFGTVSHNKTHAADLNGFSSDVLNIKIKGDKALFPEGLKCNVFHLESDVKGGFPEGADDLHDQADYEDQHQQNTEQESSYAQEFCLVK